VITDEHRRNHLDRLVEAWDRIFDPEIVGLRHADRKSPRSIDPACEESLHYALALLEMAERSRQGRAEVIINRLLEAPVLPGSAPLTLALIWHRHRRRLPSALIEKITSHLGAAAKRIRSINTDKNSPAPSDSINEIFVLLTVARIFDDATLRSRAISHLDSLAGNSSPPPRASRDSAVLDWATALAGLRAIDTYSQDSAIAAPMEAALQRFQNESLSILQKNTGKNSGTDPLTLLVSSAIRGIQCGSPDSGRRTFAALYACVMKIESPAILISDEAALPAQ